MRVAGRFTVNDAVSGFGSATISFKGPDGSVDPANTVVVSDPSQYAVSGTTLSGTVAFTAVLAAPALGAWSIAGVDLADLEGNTRTYSAAQLGANTAFTVAAGTPDTQGPTLSALTITPSVDTTGGPRAVTVRITTSDTDPLATGLLSGSVDLASSDGTGTLHFEFDGDLPVAGDYENGTYADTETLGRFARGGTWVVTDVDLWDAAQNEHDYPQNALPAALGQAAPTLTVTSATDTDAPRLTSVSADASQADVSGGNPVHVHVERARQHRRLRAGRRRGHADRTRRPHGPRPEQPRHRRARRCGRRRRLPAAVQQHRHLDDHRCRGHRRVGQPAQLRRGRDRRTARQPLGRRHRHPRLVRARRPPASRSARAPSTPRRARSTPTSWSTSPTRRRASTTRRSR